MTETSSNHDKRRTFGWIGLPLAIFPLVALFTYDWHAIASLQTPAAISSNWIGALGDSFAYYGYLTFGLAIWVVPTLCIAAALVRLAGHRILSWARLAWTLLVLVTLAALVQTLEGHAPGIDALCRTINISATGGVVGYLVMTRCLIPLIGGFGATLLMGVLLAAATLGLIGIHNIANFFLALFHWAAGTDETTSDENAFGAMDDTLSQMTLRERRQEERRRAKEAKKAEKEAKRQAKLDAQRRLQEQREAELEAIRAAREAARAARIHPVTPPSAPKATQTLPSSARTTEDKQAPDDKGPYVLPSVSLLAPHKTSMADHSDVDEMSQRLVDTLKLFGVDATVSYTVMGPVVTKYALELAPGTRYTTVTGLSDNLMGALHAKSLRIEAPIPGEDRVGIEVPNRAPAGISFREIFESDAWKGSNAELPLLFGKRADGKELVADLASMPHMLVAGATGQGKSVCLNSLICGLLMTRTPEQLKLIMVDPKCVEFTPYASIPHLLVPVITDNRKVVFSLHWAVAEMEKRLKLFARAHVRNIYDFNRRASFTQTDMFGEDTAVGSDMPRTVPYIVIIIDEAADLIGQCGKEVNPDIQRITQKARAAGIHLVLATQRPDAKIITGSIKANIPGRVAFKTSSSVDSRTILDDTGAENLIGKGDMLFKGKDGLLIRAQGAWISDTEIASITSFIEQHANTQFDEKFATKLGRVKEAAIDDPFASNEDDPDNQPQSAEERTEARQMVKAAADADDFKKAVECVINTQRASTSHFQRQMGWGYNHAAKILDMLTERGVVSPPQGMGPRSIVMSQDQLVAILNGDAASGKTAPATPLPSNDLFNQTEEQPS